MTDKEKEKLEDLIIAILLTNVDLRQYPNGRSLYFTLERRKVSILMDYIQRYNLDSQIEFNESKLEGNILPSLMLETILRSWVSNNRVRSIDPLTLRTNTYYLWISLFAMKTLNRVGVPTELDPDIQHTLSNLFQQQFGVGLVHGPIMQIIPFSPVMLKAIKNNRPIEESLELSYLLPVKEKENMKALVAEWEKERANYAY